MDAGMPEAAAARFRITVDRTSITVEQQRIGPDVDGEGPTGNDP